MEEFSALAGYYAINPKELFNVCFLVDLSRLITTCFLKAYIYL